MSPEERAKREAFIKALNALCLEHGLYITLGCGCCGGSELTEHNITPTMYKLDKHGRTVGEA